MRRRLSIFLVTALLITTVVAGYTTVAFVFPRLAVADASFRFVAWSDTHTDPALPQNNTAISVLSDQIVSLNPSFTIIPGDLEEHGFSNAEIATWRKAVNGQFAGDPASNNLSQRTFPVRGNHDIMTLNESWQDYFSTREAAAQIGATNYTCPSGKEDLTYSFDYGNSHFVGLDLPGRFDVYADNTILSWLDADLAAAEARGLTHAFLFFHGPVYCIQAGTPNMCPYCPEGERVSELPAINNAMVDLINKRQIISAIFNGHEGTNPYTHLDSTRIPALTHHVEQILVGHAVHPNTIGYGFEARYDYCPTGTGFVSIDVNGNSFTANWYAPDNPEPIKSMTFTKNVEPTPTPTITPTPTPTPTEAPTPTETPTETPTPTPTPAASLVGAWAFNEGAGAATGDSSGNGNTGTLMNNAAWVVGRSGATGDNCISFNGTTSVISAGSNDSLDNIGNGTNGNGLTISAWIYPKGLGEGGAGRIVDKARGIPVTNGWTVNMSTSSNINFRVTYNGKQLQKKSAAGTVALRRWQHIAITWNGSARASGVHIYINGQEKGYMFARSATGYRISDADEVLSIGNSIDGSRAFKGKIDDVKIFNRVLSKAEIKALAGQ